MENEVTMDQQRGPAERVRQAQRRAALIVYGMAGSLVAYILVVETLHRVREVPVAAPDVDVIRYIFYALGVSMVFVAQLVKVAMLRGTAGAPLDTVLVRLRMSAIVVAALAETPAVLGLVMFIVWNQYSDFYILSFVSLYVFMRHFPRYASWQKAAQNAMRAAAE